MIGERPQNDAFAELFDWPDSLIDLPYGSPSIADVIQESDREPERQNRARRTSVAQSLLRHDWIYRWETILKAVEMAPTPQAVERRLRLSNLADEVMSGSATGISCGQQRHS
jgi:hypothetical protein